MENEWRLDDLNSAISALEDAIDALKVIGNMDDAECLGDMIYNIRAEASAIESELDAEAEGEQNALESEYWRSVV